MLKRFLLRNWPYMITAVAGVVLLTLKFSEGKWQAGMIWLAATAYWLVKLYQNYQKLVREDGRKYD